MSFNMTNNVFHGTLISLIVLKSHPFSGPAPLNDPSKAWYSSLFTRSSRILAMAKLTEREYIIIWVIL